MDFWYAFLSFRDTPQPAQQSVSRDQRGIIDGSTRLSLDLPFDSLGPVDCGFFASKEKAIGDNRDEE